jgi:hypothetical protein
MSFEVQNRKPLRVFTVYKIFQLEFRNLTMDKIKATILEIFRCVVFGSL